MVVDMENFRGIRIKRLTETDLFTLQGIPIHAKPELKPEPELKIEAKIIGIGFTPEESMADYEEKAQDAEDKADAEEAVKVLAVNEPTVSLEEAKQILAEDEVPASDSKEVPAETGKKKQRRK
jgi:hypothetical protein